MVGTDKSCSMSLTCSTRMWDSSSMRGSSTSQHRWVGVCLSKTTYFNFHHDPYELGDIQSRVITNVHLFASVGKFGLIIVFYSSIFVFDSDSILCCISID